jgi:periplasmic protein TonB
MMSDDRTTTSADDESGGQAPPLTAGTREVDVPSVVSQWPRRRWSLAASFAFHGALVLGLFLLALWPQKLPEEKVLTVTLVTEGPGAAGASGGEQGGGGAAKSSAPQPTPPAEAAAPAPPPEPTPAPTPPTPSPPPKVAEAPAPEPPPPPPRKPPPPRRLARAPTPTPAPTPPPLPAPQQLATAPATQPTPGAPGTGSGPGGTAGLGSGAEGAGHGAVGEGPIEGPGDDYLDRLRRWLNKYKRYPDQAKKDKEQGHLVVAFTILRDGTVLDPHIEHSSGFPLLDQAALAMLHDASPVPPLPERYRAARLAIVLPVDFSIGLLDRVF